MTEPWVSACCEGEKCLCGAPAEFKIEETVFDDDPLPTRHPLTAYVCRKHFTMVMGTVGLDMIEWWRAQAKP